MESSRVEVSMSEDGRLVVEDGLEREASQRVMKYSTRSLALIRRSMEAMGDMTTKLLSFE